MVVMTMESTDGNTTTGGSKSSYQWPSFRVTPPDPVLGKKEMSPEQSLVEFISTSAAFHQVKKQQLRTLEWDLLKVFPNNIMPANAAAWFMAKRKFYMNQPLEQQLLPFLLKKYPDKFKIVRNQVIFLEKYSKETAKRKLQYLVQYGINAYFAHKADEYGVYFFDPFYYENTEPFHESLRQTTNKPNAHRSKLVPEYFKAYRDQFKFEQHSPYLVSISKQPGVKVVTNTTGVIVSMVNNQYGFIKFGSSEKALFCAKSLFRDGWQYMGDPLRLPAMQFDGYQIPGGGTHGEQQYTWYAVLVWCGRKPSPKFCSTTDDLNSTPVFRSTQVVEESNQVKKLRQPSSSMMIGQVIEIRKNGAIVSVRDDSEEKVYVPGWRHENQTKRGVWLTTLTGENIGLRDLVAYYVDTNATKTGYHAVGKNVMVLKEYEEVDLSPRKKSRRRISSTVSSRRRGASEGSDNYDSRRRVREDSSDDDSYDIESELEVDDSELEWLENDIDTIIGTEPPEAKTLRLLEDVKFSLVGARKMNAGRTTANRSTPARGKVTPSPGQNPLNDSGVASKETTPRVETKADYQPLPDHEASFWRLKAALASLEEYDSGEDVDYEPGQEIYQEKEVGHESSASESSVPGEHTIGKDRRRRMSSMASSGVTSGDENSRGLPYWVKQVQQPMVWCPHANKFLVLDIGYKEERDPDYRPPFSDDDDEESEEEEDIKVLIKEAEEPIPQELLEGKHRINEAVTKIPKILITPVKGEEGKGEEDSKPEIEIINLEDSSEKSEDDGRDGDKSGENDHSMGSTHWWVRELILNPIEEADYDSDIDPEYIPSTIIMDTDLDYDEFDSSDDAISDTELKQLREEQESSLEPGPELPIQICGCQPDKQLEPEHADKRSAVSLSPENGTGMTPAMKKLKLSSNTAPLSTTIPTIFSFPTIDTEIQKLTLNDLENNEKAKIGEASTKSEEEVIKSKDDPKKQRTPKKVQVKVGEKEKTKSPEKEKTIPEKIKSTPEKVKLVDGKIEETKKSPQKVKEAKKSAEKVAKNSPKDKDKSEKEKTKTTTPAKDEKERGKVTPEKEKSEKVVKTPEKNGKVKNARSLKKSESSDEVKNSEPGPSGDQAI